MTDTRSSLVLYGGREPEWRVVNGPVFQVATMLPSPLQVGAFDPDENVAVKRTVLRRANLVIRDGTHLFIWSVFVEKDLSAEAAEYMIASLLAETFTRFLRGAFGFPIRWEIEAREKGRIT